MIEAFDDALDQQTWVTWADDDASAGGGYVNGAGDPIAACHAHFPERSLKMLDIGLPDPLQPMAPDQSHNSQIAGLNVLGLSF